MIMENYVKLVTCCNPLAEPRGWGVGGAGGICPLMGVSL